MTFALEPSAEREIVTSRTFAAPAARVFAAWTTPALVQRWLLGPEGWTMPVCEIDLEVGGAIRYVWRHTDGREFGMTGRFREIEAPRRLVHTEVFDMDWTGGETVVTTTFTETDGSTAVHMSVLYASRDARDGAVRSGMETGVAASYERLDGMLDAGTGLSTPRVVDVERAFAAVVQANIPMAEIPAAQRAARARLSVLSTHPAAQPLGARLTIWRLPGDGRMDYALCARGRGSSSRHARRPASSCRGPSTRRTASASRSCRPAGPHTCDSPAPTPTFRRPGAASSPPARRRAGRARASTWRSTGRGP